MDKWDRMALVLRIWQVTWVTDPLQYQVVEVQDPCTHHLYLLVVQAVQMDQCLGQMVPLLLLHLETAQVLEEI